MRRSWVITAASALLALTATAIKAQTVRWDPLNEAGHQGRGSMLRVSPFSSGTVLTSGDTFGAAITTDNGATWQSCLGMCDSTGNNPCVNDFTYLSSTTVWCGSMAGPYLSTDGGHNWTVKRNGMPAASSAAITCPIQKIIQDPNTPATLIAMCGNHRQMGYTSSAWGQVWKSTNGGTSWGTGPIGTVAASAVVKDRQVNDCCFAKGSSTVLYAACNSGLYKSIDSGATWNPVSGTPATICYCVTPDPTNANVIYAGFSNNFGVYKTTTATTTGTWSAANTGISTGTPNDLNAPVESIAIAPSNPSVLYLGFWGATYYSNNSGSSWSKINWAGSNSTVSPASGVPGNLAFQWLSVDSSNAATVWGTGDGNVWRSTNSGVAWTTLTNYPTNGAYRGNGWSGLDGTMAAWNPYRAGEVWTLGFDSGKQLRTSDYLWSWLTGDTFTGSDGPWNGAHCVTFSNDGTVYIGAGQNGNTNPYVNEPIIKYKPGATPVWSYLSYPSGGYGECMSIYTLPTDSTKIWACYGYTGRVPTASTPAKLYYSSNGGASWAPITPTGATYSFNVTASPATPNVIYVSTDVGVFQSAAGGATFPNPVMTGSPHTGQMVTLYPDPSTANSIYGIMWKSSSPTIYHYNGTAWSTLASYQQYSYALAVDPHNSQRIAMVTRTDSPTYDLDHSSGIYLSTDGGAHFTPYNTNLKINSATGISFNPDSSSQLIAMMDGGLFVTDWGTSTAHGGTVPSIVGTLSSANYDSGGANIAYSGSTAPSPATVAGTTGQWIKYQVNVPTTGTYTITLNAKSTAVGPKYHIELNGVNVTGPIALGNTSGSWTNFNSTVHLTAGTQYLKVYCEAGGGFFNSITTSTTGGSMSGSTGTTTGGFNLTALTGTAGNDWAKYGRAGVYTNFDHKSSGGGKITVVSAFGAGEAHGAWADPMFNVSWTDGATAPTSATDGATLYSNAPYGSNPTGFKFTVPADTTSRTVTVFWGGSQASIELNAHLSDGSAVDYDTGNIGSPASGTQLKQSTITYSAASAGQTLTITLSKTGDDRLPITNGSVDLICAWLK